MPTPAVHLPEHIRRELVDHCLAQLPNEGCGLLAVANGEVMAAYPTSNADASPRSYTIPPAEHYAALVDAESKGWEIGGVFHSHPNGPRGMSEVDMERALEKEWVYLVVDLAGSEPVVTQTRVR